MIIEESVDIQAPLPVVWRVFSTMEDGQNWNTVCKNCCIISGDGMAQNTCFTFQMRPYYLPIKVMPTITKCEPGKEVNGSAKKWIFFCWFEAIRSFCFQVTAPFFFSN